MIRFKLAIELLILAESKDSRNKLKQYDLDLVIECSGVFRTKESLQPYLDMGVKRVLVSAPVKEDGVLNVVVGVNDNLFDLNDTRL